MKKLLSVLLAVVLCVAFTTIAFAEESSTIDTEELSKVVDEIVGAAGSGDIEGVAGAVQVNADKLYAAFGDILEGTETVEANEAADYVVTAISELTGADMENVREIVMDAIEEYDLGSVEIVDSSEVAGLVDKILERLESLGIDTDPIIDKLAESKVGGAIVGIYTGETETASEEEPDPPKTTTKKVNETPTDPDPIPTGHASSIAAFAVLAVAAAGAYVCTRKKAE